MSWCNNCDCVSLHGDQESLERARRDLGDARERAAPLERERAAATEETRHLEERCAQAKQTLEELRKQVGNMGFAPCDNLVQE